MSPLGVPVFLAAAKSTGYQIGQSLRFNSGDSAYLNRTPGSAGNRKTWTWSGWVKRSKPGAEQAIFANVYTSPYTDLRFESNDTINFYDYSGSYNYRLATTQVFRDPSAWYHIVAVLDTTAPSVKLYVNGSQVTAFSTNTQPSSNFEGGINSTKAHYIGSHGGTSHYLDGYLAEVNFIDGSALGPESFGKYDANGVWTPVGYAGSYTGNSFYLKFASGDGTDSSGLSNTWTANNFTTSGTGTDVMSDTPTNNWCTLNSLCKSISGVTLSEGNLKAAYPSSPPTGMHVGTLATTNAFYVEAKATAATSNQIYLGVETPDRGNVTTSYPGGGSDGWGYGMNGRIYNNGSTVVDTGTTYTTNDVIGIACDPSSGTIQFFKNGTSVYSGTSVANVPLTICVSQSGGSGNSGTIEINCGQRAFEQTAPSGFSPLNTSNIPAPEIKDGSDYFNTITYTGDGTASRSLTGVGFAPNFVWIKNRDVARHHSLHDAVRGTGRYLLSASTSAELVQTTLGLASFDSDGFTLGTSTTSGGGQNGSGEGYVAWNWLGANGTETLTAGSIQSTVSANPTAGFSIVSYTGNATSGATVGHGLGVAPSMVILKSRDSATNWYVWHAGLTQPDYQIYLNLTNAQDTSVLTFLNDKAPTSTVFELPGSGYGSNNSGVDYIAYCFAEVEGYSKFGYVSGLNNDEFVYLGFKPAWIMFKRTSTTSNWAIRDNKRDTYNISSKEINADTSNAENTFAALDFLSNGFKARSFTGVSGGWIYAAFAENPFGGSGVSPATAR